MSVWTWIDGIGALFVLLVLGVVWYFHFRETEPRRIWRCIRFQGGGSLVSPREMTLEEVTQWLASNQAEVAHVDHENGFVFYRPRG